MKSKIMNYLIVNDIYFEDFLFLFITIFVGTCNIMFYSSQIIQYSLILLQILFLLYFFIKKDCLNYLCYLVSFVSLSLEFDVFMPSNTWYGLLQIEIFGLRGIIFLIFPLFILVYQNRHTVFDGIGKKDIPEKALKLITFTILCAIIVGIVLIILNDNNIRSLSGYLSSFFSLCYFYLFTIAFMILCYFIICLDDSNLNKVKKRIIMILTCLCMTALISYLFCDRGKYDIYDYLIVSSAIFFIPLLILLPLYKRNILIWFTFIMGCVGFFITLSVGSSGKSIIILFLLPIIFFCTFYKKMKFKYKKYIMLTFVILLLFLFFLCVFKSEELLSLFDGLISDKINQVLSLFKIWDKNYLLNLPPSPRCRVIEILNVSYEYIEKPWQILFGKGFLGSFTDHTGVLFGIGEAFTQNQWDSGIFYLPHESFSRLFLTNGLIGVYLFFWIVKITLKNILNSPWMLVGMFWFIFFFGYSFSLSFLGILLFTVGLVDIDMCHNRTYKVCVLDFLFLNGHKFYCGSFVDSLNKKTTTLIINNKDYYTYIEDSMHIKKQINAKKIPGQNFFDSRLKIFFNIYQNLKQIKGYRFEKIIIFGYENITFQLLRRVINKYGKIYLVHHHQIDEMSESFLKRNIFDTYKNKVSHIVLEDFIKDSLVHDFNINKELIYKFPIPLMKEKDLSNYKINNESTKYIIALSNSNDEELINKIILSDDIKFFIEKYNFKIIFKSKGKHVNTQNIYFINKYISDNEYMELFEKSNIILLPFSKKYINRASGTIVDALSLKKKVICSNTPIAQYYEAKFPNLCATFNDDKDFLKKVERLNFNFSEIEYEIFVKEHDESYLLKCIDEIIGGY